MDLLHETLIKIQAIAKHGTRNGAAWHEVLETADRALARIPVPHPSTARGATVTDADLVNARTALRRGARPGEAIPTCSCFKQGQRSKNCNGLCEDAVEWVARAIAEAREAE